MLLFLVATYQHKFQIFGLHPMQLVEEVNVFMF